MVGLNDKHFVRKRDGKVVDFDAIRIRNAIAKAFEAVNEQRTDLVEAVTNHVLAELPDDQEIYDIEFIQDTVERSLVEFNLYSVSKAYILYRHQHSDIRKLGFILGSNEVVDNYINMLDWRVKENSNMSYSMQGLNNHISTVITSNYWLSKLYPEKIRRHHEQADFHIHDLGTLGAYCCGWDLPDLLKRGFGGVSAKLESKPAKRFRTALGQVVNFFYTLQGESAGAQAFANFDTYLAPFIAYDNLSYEEVRQCMQEFIFNMNVPTRVGFQTPFTNLTMDLICPQNLQHLPAIIGGKDQEKTLGEFQKEMDLLNRAFIEVMTEGDAKGRIFTFPIPTYNITKDFDWENPAYEGLWAMTAKYGIPYFANFVNSDLSPDDARSMCCRLRIDNRELWKRGGGLFGANPLTGSIGVVTLNLPRLAYLSKTKEAFFANLDEWMADARDSLIIKRKVLEHYTTLGLYPYSKHYLEHIFGQIRTYWGNHFSTIGLVGMNECVLTLLGKNLATPEGHGLAIEILEHMRKNISDFQEQTGNLFNLEATPAEGASYRLARVDKAEFPDMVVANDAFWRQDHSVAPYYTNSSHLPVNYTHDVFEALENQDALQTKYTGGTVLHIFVGEKKPSADGIKELVRTISHSYHLPYFTLTPTFSICPSHGYISGEQQSCPECKCACEVYSRIVGYFRPIQNWNAGKRQEFSDRLLYELTKVR